MFGLSTILIFFIELGYPNKSEFHDDFSKVGEYESSEPTSLATTSTMEGEHTLSPGAGEDAGEGLGEVSFQGTPLICLYCEVSPALCSCTVCGWAMSMAFVCSTCVSEECAWACVSGLHAVD